MLIHRQVAELVVTIEVVRVKRELLAELRLSVEKGGVSRFAQIGSAEGVMGVKKSVVSDKGLFELRNGLIREVSIRIGEAKLHMDLSRVAELNKYFCKEFRRTVFIEHGEIRLCQGILVLKGWADGHGGFELDFGSVDVDDAEHYLTEKPMQLCHSQAPGVLWR